MARQPNWKLVCELGDVNPIDYGGHFVYVDTTGVYPPEAEILIPDDDDSGDDASAWTVYRYILEPCTYTGGILSDNRFHPDHPAWFADSLSSVASYVGMAEAEIIAALIGDDLAERAHAWKAIGDYHGMENLDSYPLRFADRNEIESRYVETVE